MRVSIDIPPPPHWSEAARNETEDAVRSLLLSVVRRWIEELLQVARTRQKGDSVVMPVESYFHNRARYRSASSVRV
jgi:hypothetical protein